MSNLIWKLKQWFRKLMPIAMIGLALYGGHSLYKQGVFRRGLKPAITTMLYKLPYFGSRFRHYSQSSSYSYRGGRSYRHGRRHHGGRRHRRHRR